MQTQPPFFRDLFEAQFPSYFKDEPHKLCQQSKSPTVSASPLFEAPYRTVSPALLIYDDCIHHFPCVATAQEQQQRVESPVDGSGTNIGSGEMSDWPSEDGLIDIDIDSYLLDDSVSTDRQKNAL